MFSWMNSPSKTLVTIFTLTMFFALFGNFLIFILMALFAIVYGHRVRSRNDDELLKSLADYLTAIGKTSLIFVFTVMVLSFIQTSIYVSDTVPKMYSLIPQSCIVITGFLYLITGVTNLFRMNRALTPIYSPFSVIPLSVSLVWRFFKKQIALVWSELRKPRN